MCIRDRIFISVLEKKVRVAAMLKDWLFEMCIRDRIGRTPSR